MKIKEQFNKIKNSKSISEMLYNTPYSFPKFLLFIPLFLMMILPAFQLAESLIYPEGNSAGYGAHLTTFVSNTYSVHYYGVILGAIAMLIFICKKISDKSRLSFPYSSKLPVIFFAFFLLWMLLSTAVNGITDFVIHGHTLRNENLFVFIMYFVFYFGAAAVMTTERKKAVLLYTYLVSGVLIGIASLIHLYIAEIEAFSFERGLTAVYHNSNHYAYFILMNILISGMLFLREKKPLLRAFAMFSFILNTVLLIINNTFGCYLAAFLALIFAVIVVSICDRKFSKGASGMFLLFVLITFVMSFFYQTVLSSVISFIGDIGDIIFETEEMDLAGTGRWLLWTNTAEYITEKPLFGFGLEGIGERLAELTPNHIDRPHCEFLQYAAFFGIPAAIAYIGGIFGVFLNGLKHKYSLDKYTLAALVAAFGYLVSSTFGNTMYYTAPHFFIILGTAFSTGRTRTDEK